MTDFDTCDDSGPFCEHYGDPSDCDELCKCGHTCGQHCWGECNQLNCECEKFIEE